MTKISYGTKCPCCSLKYPEELYPWTDKKKVARNFSICMGCKRTCKYVRKSSCHLGDMEA